MKKFVVKFLLVISLFFSAFSFAGKRGRRSLTNESNINRLNWDKIVNILVDTQIDYFDVFKCIERNAPGSLDIFIKSMDFFPLFAEDGIYLRNNFIEEFHLNKLALVLNVSINSCVNKILEDCNKAIVSRVLNSENSIGITPLQFALNKGYWEMALDLLENGANFFVVNSSEGISYRVLLSRKIIFLNPNIPVELLDRFKLYAIKYLDERFVSLRESKEILSEIFPLGRELSLSSIYNRLLINDTSFN